MSDKKGDWNSRHCFLDSLMGKGKDAENVAEGLRKCSHGKILTGVYHADRHDREKEGLHVAWRKGSVKVVCATIGKCQSPQTVTVVIIGYKHSVWFGYRQGRCPICVASFSTRNYLASFVC